MLSLRNPKLLEASSTAAQTFRRLHVSNRVCYALLGLIALLGIWNILSVATLIRGANTPDLADASSILSHPSSRLIWIVSAITLAIFVFKEWKWGERGFAMVFFLAALLFLVLIPTMSAEVEPKNEAMMLELTYSLCQPGGIEDGKLLNADRCEIETPAEGEVFLSDADPTSRDTTWLKPDRYQSGFTRWNIEARGRFRVYFIIQQPSMDHCETAQVAVSKNTTAEHSCFEQDGAVWMVVPFETSAVESGYLTLYQEVAP